MMNKQGLFWGFISYTMWGFFPIYWKLFAGRSATEVLAHRMVWSFLFYILIALFFAQNIKTLFQQSKRDWLLSTLASILLTINWGVYIYAVNTGHILEGSLAYFINPILNVAVGVLFFKESFPPILKFAVGAAAIGVVSRIWLTPQFPWLSLLLASTFCMYGITKKLLKIPVMTSSVLESSVGILPALIGVIYFSQQADVVAPTPTLWMLFIAGGVVTGLPLFLFSFAAQRVPYSVMGVLQFIAPSLQFLVGVLMYNEAFGRNDLIAFGFIWAGMGFYLAHQLIKFRAQLQQSKTIS